MAIAEALITATGSAAAKKLIDEASPHLFEKIGKRLSKELDKTRVQFTKTFGKQIARSLSKSYSVKTIIARDKPVPLNDIYVSLFLNNSTDSIVDDDLIPVGKSGERIVISGTGGAGKTILMKHLLNRSCVSCDQKIPIFVELRSLDFSKEGKLASHIIREFNDEGYEESLQLFEAGLEEGIFSIFLDGFDEIAPNHVEKALRLIQKFSHQYASVNILISTRPNTGITRINEFLIYNLCPLNKQQAIELISKTDFDQVTKERFLLSLDNGLYDKHKSLMSIPMLLVMMLLTFRTYADIPDRMTVFYGQAFETLYSIHDAENKELFRRTHNAGLAPDIFKRVLEAFSYFSLSKHKIEFSSLELHDFIKNAVQYTGVDTKVEDFRSNLINNVCVIQPDEISFVFVHRSFQEYFASRFALTYSGDKVFEVIDQIVNVSGSAVASMMSEIDMPKFERYWAERRLSEFLSMLRDLESGPVHRKFTAFFERLFFQNRKDTIPGYGLGHTSGKNIRLMEVLAASVDTRLSFGRLMSVRYPPISLLKSFEKSASKTEVLQKKNDYPTILLPKGKYVVINDETEGWFKQSNFDEIFTEYKNSVEEVMSQLVDRVSSRRELDVDLLP